MIGDLAVLFECGEEDAAFKRIQKAIVGEGTNVAIRYVGSVPEDALEERVDRGSGAVDRADVCAFANSVEESFEGAGTVGHQGFFGGAGGGIGVGVLV